MVVLDDVGARDRTLTHGLTIAGDHFHAYVQDSMIHVYIYTYADVVGHFWGKEFPIYRLRPSQYAIPEHTAVDFAYLMKSHDYPLHFTAFDEEQYYNDMFKTYYAQVSGDSV